MRASKTTTLLTPVIVTLCCLFSFPRPVVSLSADRIDIMLEFYPITMAVKCNLSAIKILETNELITLQEMSTKLSSIAINITNKTCYYQDHGRNKSLLVALNVRNGFVSGLLTIHPFSFSVENAAIHPTGIITMTNKTNFSQPGLCRSKRPMQEPEYDGQDYSLQSVKTAASLDLNYVNVSMRNYYVELYLIADNAFYRKHLADSANYLFEIVNYVNALYRSEGIHILLVAAEVWSSANKISIPTDSDNLLESLKNYRTRLTVRHDNLHMINGISYDEDVLGLAFTDGMCWFGYSTGISSDGRSYANSLKTAITMAHEMGHNLGLDHDEASCSYPDSACIMSKYSTSKVNPLRWSDCSLQTLRTNLKSGSSSFCLNEMPSSVVAFHSNLCGNGIVDSDEDCDPGWLDTNSICCNVATCKFANNAHCASGPCCDKVNCTLIPAGVTCRTVKDECDLGEYCNGTSEWCPTDVHKMDGETCDDKRGTCYQGTCASHNKQCQLLYGSSSRSAEDTCYSYYNTLNSSSRLSIGYCNYTFYKVVSNSITYSVSTCSWSNNKCGTLHCQGPSKPLWSSLYSYFRKTTSSGAVCNHVFFDVTLTGLRDPGMVPNGAICENNKICVNSECVDSVQQSAYCNCSGNGVCNNRGNCHCNYGYNGNVCESLSNGCGGSVDSGPACNYSYVYTTIKPSKDEASGLSSGTLVSIIAGSAAGILILAVIAAGIIKVKYCAKSQSPIDAAPPLQGSDNAVFTVEREIQTFPHNNNEPVEIYSNMYSRELPPPPYTP